MPEIDFLAQIGASWDPLGTDIRDLTVIESGEGSVLIATTGPAGGIMSLAFDGTGLEPFASVSFSGPIGGNVTGTTASLTQEGEDYFIVSATHQGQAIGYKLNSDGGVISPATPGLALYAGHSGPVIASSTENFVYTKTEPGLLQGFAYDGSGYQLVAAVRDTADIALADPVALRTVAVGGTEFLLALSGEETGVTVMEISSGSGALSVTGTIGTATGLGLLENPTDLQTIELADKVYLLVSSAADSGAAGALTVMELRSDGSLLVTDHILDSLATRFGTAATLDTAKAGDWAYVALGGGDAGISLFALAPGGRLVHLDTIADTLASGLETISALSLVAEENDLHIFAASQASQGLAQMKVDISRQGLVLEAGSGRLQGQEKADLLVGGYGQNDLRGAGGDDVLIDGYGIDTLWGGVGSDTFILEADGSRDEIRDFEPGKDRIDLSAIPFLYDSSRLSVIERAWGAELLFADSEETIIRSANGGPLTEAQILSSINWVVDRPPLSLISKLIGDGQRNTLDGTEGTDIIEGRDGNDLLRGLAGDDRIDGGTGFDTIMGGDGEDTLLGGKGRDLIEGGAGDDTIEDSPQGGLLGQDSIWGGVGNDSLSSGGGHDLVYGEDGNDKIFAGWGNDTVVGGNGNDTLLGEIGFDTIEGGEGGDMLLGGKGNDWLSGDTGNDTILGGLHADSIMGGTGDDRLEGQHGLDTIDGGQGNDWIHGGLFRDQLFGGEGNDTLDGARHNDRLAGGFGDDVLIGGNGADRLFGERGADHLLGGGGRDILGGGLGNDSVHGGSMSDTVWGGGGNDTVNGGAGPDLVKLGDGDDLFIGFLQGGALGRDTIWGGTGNDTINASAGDDVVQGAAGNDQLFGGGGNDKVTGGTGNDTLGGGQGNDTLHGGPGNDRLEAGGGMNLLTGGTGADVFVFHTTATTSTITDFTPGIDQLELDIAELSHAHIDVVGASSGLRVIWEGGEVLLEDLPSDAFDLVDVIFG